MKTLKILAPLFLLCFCGQLQAQQTTYSFANRNRTYDIELAVNNVPRTTIKRSARESLTLNIGDVVTVSVKNKPELTWYPIYITEKAPKVNPIVINPNVVWFTNDARAVGTDVLNYYYNTKGIHIHDYDPQAVAESFKTAEIFEGISKEAIDYEITDDGGQFIYTEGFTYRPLNKGAEEIGSTFTQNVNDYKRTFNVSASVSGAFPTPAGDVNAGIDFGYKKTNQQTKSSDSFNWSEYKKVFTYEILVDEPGLGRIRMHPDFLDYIDGMDRNAYSVQDFVNRYGTHFPVSVEYGGQYVKYISMEKDDYYKGEQEGWDLGINASLSKAGEKTITSIPGGLSVKGNNESSQVAGVNLNFGEVKEKNERDLMEKTNHKAMYIGGSLNGDSWGVTPQTATAVSVRTKRISDLFYPHILKNNWTEDKCRKWREAVEAEVKRQETLLPRLAAQSKIKTRRFMVRTLQLNRTFEVDDTDKRIRGNIWLESKTPSVKPVAPGQINGRNVSEVLWAQGAFAQQSGTKEWVEKNAGGGVINRFTETGRDDWSVYLFDNARKVRIALDLWTKQIKYQGPNEPAYRNLYGITGTNAAPVTIWREDNFTDVFTDGPIASMHQSKYGKWQVFEQTSDANGNFAPIKFQAKGQLFEAGVFGGEDRLDFTRGVDIDLGLGSGSIEKHVMKLENNKTLAERYHVEVTIEFKPNFDFAGLFRTGGVASNARSATAQASSLPNPKVTMPTWKQPDGKIVYTSNTNTANNNTGNTTTSSPSPEPKKVDGRNVTKVFFQSGSFVQESGAKNWVEKGTDGATRFRFEETGRDDWSVYLFDKSRNVRIALDLWTKQVKYQGPNEPNYRRIGDISGAQ